MTRAPGPVAAGRQVVPVYAAGFVTAFGAHAVGANLGRYALAGHGSLWEVGLLLGIYDGAEVVLKPVFGALADRAGAKPVMAGGLWPVARDYRPTSPLFQHQEEIRSHDPRALAPECRRRRPRGRNLVDRGGAKAERMRGAGGAVHRAGAGVPRRVMCTKGRPVPAAEYGVMAAALGHRLRLAVARRLVVEILAQAAPAMRRPRPARPG